jgi:hypothetical protein
MSATDLTTAAMQTSRYGYPMGAMLSGEYTPPKVRRVG